jgi:hypothetical protein
MTQINENAWIYATVAGIRFRYDPTSGVIQRYFMSNKWETMRSNTRARKEIIDAILEDRDKNPAPVIDANYVVYNKIPTIVEERRVNPDYVVRSQMDNVIYTSLLFQSPAFEYSYTALMEIAADMFVLKAEGIISLAQHYNLVFEGKEPKNNNTWLVRYRGYVIHRGKHIDIDVECAKIKSPYGGSVRHEAYFQIYWRHYVWQDSVDIFRIKNENPNSLKEVDSDLTAAGNKLDAWNETLLNSPKIMDTKTGIVYKDMDHLLEAIAKELHKPTKYSRDLFRLVIREFPGRLKDIRG